MPPVGLRWLLESPKYQLLKFRFGFRRIAHIQTYNYKGINISI